MRAASLAVVIRFYHMTYECVKLLDPLYNQGSEEDQSTDPVQTLAKALAGLLRAQRQSSLRHLGNQGVCNARYSMDNGLLTIDMVPHF